MLKLGMPQKDDNDDGDNDEMDWSSEYELW